MKATLHHRFDLVLMDIGLPGIDGTKGGRIDVLITAIAALCIRDPL